MPGLVARLHYIETAHFAGAYFAGVHVGVQRAGSDASDFTRGADFHAGSADASGPCAGEHWDFSEQMDTYYNPVPHFTYKMALDHSPTLKNVPTLPRGGLDGLDGGIDAL